MKQIQRLEECGYLVIHSSKEVIQVLYLDFIIKDNNGSKEVNKYPKIKTINNNSWAVTRFLNKYGGINCSKERELLKYYKENLFK